MLKKIGIIDSGIGGLTLLKEAIDYKLSADYFYISDIHHMPYGNKSQQFMFEKMSSMTMKLVNKNISHIFIACNTATAQTIDNLRGSFPGITFFGIEPYINYLNHSQTKNAHEIALILTEATYQSDRFNKLKLSHDPQGLVDIYPLRNLALIIEKLRDNKTTVQDIKSEISSELNFLKKQKYKSLVLGCTHYPIIRDFIEKEYSLQCINPASSVLSHLQEKMHLSKSHQHCGFFYSNFDNGNYWSEDDVFNFNFLP